MTTNYTFVYISSIQFLLYSCPNPLDVTPSHEPPPTPPAGLANHVRRFTVSTFQFLQNSRKETAPGEVEVVGKEEEVNTLQVEVKLNSLEDLMGLMHILKIVLLHRDYFLSKINTRF